MATLEHRASARRPRRAPPRRPRPHSRATQAISELRESGQLVLTPSETDTYAIVLERWYQARRDGAAHPIVHGRNRQRRELNQLAQQLLIDDGTVDPARVGHPT